MGKRGPRQLPKGVKILTGNAGHQRLNNDEPKPIPIADPCPDYLGDIARETWHAFAPRLEELGMLTELDGPQFRNLCVIEEVIQRTYARMAKRKGYAMTTQSGYRQQMPEVSILNQAIMQMNRLSDRFGLDPISRQSLKTPRGQESGSKLKGLLSR